MTIGKLDSNSTSVSASMLESVPDVATRGDADWFRAALQRQEPDPNFGGLSEHVVSPLTRKTLSLEELSKDAGKALREASLDADPVKFMQASRALSDYYLQTSLSVKIISKGFQAMDKLTSMQ